MTQQQLGQTNYTVGIRDLVSKSIEQLSGKVRTGLDGSLQTMTANLQNNLDNVSRNLGRIGAQATATGLKIAGVGLAAGLPIVATIKTFADLDDQLRALGAITEALPDDLESVSAKIKQLGETTSFSASEVAAGAIALGRGGFSTAEIEDSLESVLALSRATGTELASAADIAANAVRSFELPTSETARVVDVLTATANGSTQTLTDLAFSLKFAAPAAKEAGASIEETSAALGILASIGIKGSSAGTALRTAFLSLADTDVQKTLDGMGVSVLDLNKEFRPLNAILADFARATENKSGPERLAAATQLFGREAALQATALGTAAEAVTTFETKMRNAEGTAIRAAAAMDAGIGGFFRRFRSFVEGSAIRLGEKLEPALLKLEERFNKIAPLISKFIDDNGELVLAVAAGAVGLIAAGGALATFGLAATGAAAVVSLLSTAIGVLSALMTGLGVVLGALFSPIGLIVAAIAAGVVAFFKWTDAGQAFGAAISRVFGNIGEQIKLVVRLIRSGNIGAAWKVVTTGLYSAWASFVAGLKEGWASFISGFVYLFETSSLKIQITFSKMAGVIQRQLNKLIGGFNSLVPSALELPKFDTRANERSLKSLQDRLRSSENAIGENLAEKIEAARKPAREAAEAARQARIEARKALAAASETAAKKVPELAGQQTSEAVAKVAQELEQVRQRNSGDVAPAGNPLAGTQGITSFIPGFGLAGVANLAGVMQDFSKVDFKEVAQPQVVNKVVNKGVSAFSQEGAAEITRALTGATANQSDPVVASLESVKTTIKKEHKKDREQKNTEFKPANGGT